MLVDPAEVVPPATTGVIGKEPVFVEVEDPVVVDDAEPVVADDTKPVVADDAELAEGVDPGTAVLDTTPAGGSAVMVTALPN